MPREIQICIDRKTGRVRAGQLLFGWFALFCLLLILKNGSIAAEYIHRGLSLCHKTVIPSLFPFMVISEMLIRGGIGERVVRRICRPLSLLWGFTPTTCCCVLLGMLCGFPVGAVSVANAYRRGKIPREEAERALAVCNLPSSAFVLGAVGGSMWENPRFGRVLYAVLLGVSFLWAILLRRKRTADAYEASIRTESYPSGAALFTEAVRSSCMGILLVCAYVVFFSALTGAFGAVLDRFTTPPILRAILFSSLEMTQGVSHAASLENARMGAVLCAFGCGWSGLSVHCQILSVCDGSGLSMRTYFVGKLLQGLLCAALMLALLALFPSLLSTGQSI